VNKAYSKAYNQQKQELRNAIKLFAEQNPQRYMELQAQAQHELEHPPERAIIRHPLRLPREDTDTLIMRFRKGRKDFYIHTIDCWNDKHLYSELLHSPEDATEVLRQRHPKFSERLEKVIGIEPCICPLCVQDSRQ